MGSWDRREDRGDSLFVLTFFERLTPSDEGLAMGAALGSVCKTQKHVKDL